MQRLPRTKPGSGRLIAAAAHRATLKLAFAVSAAIVAGCACVFYVLSMPQPLRAEDIPNHLADLENGELLFWAGGCASCHAASDAEGDALLLLEGGVELETEFGIFRAPNISPHAKFGIGGWTVVEFINAMSNGLSPDFRHYYPAFPYPHYSVMSFDDLIDLKAFIDTLPVSTREVANHELKFPYSIRRGLGLWKKVYLDRTMPRPDVEMTSAIERGRYLVQGPGHCGACHTPRDAFGGRRADRFLAGANLLEIQDGSGSTGRTPNITPHADGISSWSERDIAYALETGFDPDFDSFGGSMVHVQENMAKLPAADRTAIAAYLKSIPAVPSESR